MPDPGEPIGDQLLVQVEAPSVNGTGLRLRGDLRIETWGRMPVTPGARVAALIGHGGGARAERVLLRQRRAVLPSTGASPAEAVALPLAGLTAPQALYGQAGLGARPGRQPSAGPRASGGIGASGVQLARLAGAHVTVLD